MVLSLSLGIQSETMFFYNLSSKITIHDNKFLFIVNQPHHPLYLTDTLAICSISKIDDEFYQINSDDPIQKLQNSLNVSYCCEQNLFDSLSVTFNFPGLSIPGRIVFYINDYSGESFTLPYDGKPVSTFIPFSTRKILMGFEPNLTIAHEHPHRYTFQGIITIDPAIVCDIEPGYKHVSIQCFALTDIFFERYYIHNDFIRIIDNKLYWRGAVFIKEDKDTTLINSIPKIVLKR